MKLKLLFCITILALFASSTALACYCSMLSTITSNYQQANFVGVVKILKNYKNYPDTNEHYKADVEVLNLYKGKSVKSLYILGNNGGKTYNSCGTFIQEGETRLVFGSFTKDKLVSTYLCTSYLNPFNTSYKRDLIEEKLKLLKRFAKKHTIKIGNDALLYVNDFKRIKNPKTTKHFSLVRIDLTENGTIDKIAILTKDDKELSDSLKLYFKKTFNIQRLKGIREKNNGNLIVFFEITPYKS